MGSLVKDTAANKTELCLALTGAILAMSCELSSSEGNFYIAKYGIPRTAFTGKTQCNWKCC